MVKENIVGTRFGDLKFEGKCLNDIVDEEVKQESFRSNSTRIEVGYYIERVVTPYFGRSSRFMYVLELLGFP